MADPNRMDNILNNTSSIVQLSSIILMIISSSMNAAPIIVAESILFSLDGFMLYLAPRNDDINRMHIEIQDLISASIGLFRIKTAATAHMMIELTDAIIIPSNTVLNRKLRIFCDGFSNTSPPLFDISYAP